MPSSSQAASSGGPTATVSTASSVPAGPVQLRRNSLLSVSGGTVSAPDAARGPLHAPEASQLSALAASHVSVGVPLNTTQFSFADNRTDICGIGDCATVTVIVTSSRPD